MFVLFNDGIDPSHSVNIIEPDIHVCILNVNIIIKMSYDQGIDEIHFG